MKPRILIVDDESDISELLKEALSHWKFEVETASNVREFKERVFSFSPDLIILDLMLGNENGFEFYKRQILPQLDHQVPILFFSALAQDHPSSPATPGRRYALRSKPCDLTEILHDVKCLLAA